MSNSGAWGEAPPGVNLSENQNGDIIGSVVGIMVMGLASVILRVFTRLMKTGPGLASDDYVILFAAVRRKEIIPRWQFRARTGRADTLARSWGSGRRYVASSVCHGVEESISGL